MINRKLEKIINIKYLDPVSLLGIADCNIKLVMSEIPISIVLRKEKLRITGKKDDVDQANQILNEMIETLNSKGSLEKEDVINLISMIKIQVRQKSQKVSNSQYQICHSRKGAIVTQTKGQNNYFKTVNKNDVVFCNGPAGTEKLFLLYVSHFQH